MIDNKSSCILRPALFSFDCHRGFKCLPVSLISGLIAFIEYGNPDPVPFNGKCEQDTCAQTAKCVNTGSYIYCECPPGKTGKLTLYQIIFRFKSFIAVWTMKNYDLFIR